MFGNSVLLIGDLQLHAQPLRFLRLPVLLSNSVEWTTPSLPNKSPNLPCPDPKKDTINSLLIRPVVCKQMVIPLRDMF